MKTPILTNWIGLVSIFLCTIYPARAQDRDPAGRGDRGSIPDPTINGAGGATLPTNIPPSGTGSTSGFFGTSEPGAHCDRRDACPTISENGCECRPGEVFIGAEYLFMKPRRSALDFAIVDPNADGTPQGPIESLDWGTASGVRVDLGYRFPGEGWALTGSYTYFSSIDQRSVVSPAGGILFATLTHPGFIEQVASATGRTSLTYHVFDIDIGRPFALGRSCTMRLFAGGRAAWIDQNLNVTYDGGDATNAHVSSPISYNGGGLRIGGEGHWNLRWGFSLFARCAGSLLVGHFRTRLLETDQNGTLVNTDVSDRFVQMTPVAELGLGVAWNYENLIVKLGYEMSNWFNLVDSPDFVDDVHQGKFVHRTSDLSLDGLVFQVGLGY